MARRSTIKLLLINGSDNDAERLVSLFRRAGRVARVDCAPDAEALTAALHRQVDLVLLDETAGGLSSATVLEQLRTTEAAPLAIVLSDSQDPQPLFAAGARDVVAPADEPRLVHAVLRELDHAQLRRDLQEREAQLAEAEHRNALLLDSSTDAVAYVTDGMITGASALFAERFGYADGDAVELVPIIDLIAPESQELVKSALKAQDGSDIPFIGLSGDQSFPALMCLTAATYEGEPCIQITVRERSASNSAAAAERNDSGLFSAGWLRQHLTSASGVLLVISVDGFERIRRKLGYSQSMRLAPALGDFLGSQPLLAGAPLAQLADDALGTTLPTAAADALAVAEQLCTAISEHILELDGHSLQCTVAIGLVNISSTTPEELLDRAFATCEELRAEAANGVGNGVRQWQPSAQERAQRAAASPELALQEALDEGRFEVLFQPMLSLRGSRGDHYEALLRLHGDTGELELPDNLINALNVDPVNTRLDRWVLLEGTKQLAANRAQGNDTRLVINLTASALLDTTLANWIGVALQAAGLPPETLVFQLREADVITYLKPALEQAKALRELGCRVSISGFGRALDPLKTLKTLPAEMVQLDGSFTRELQNNGQAGPLKELVSAISALEVKVVIPYVENAAVLATLWQVGADFIQGHYLQPPSRQMNYEFADIA
ncbi:MAG: EAL domain-containing protein [Spongiibacteraceae bacterium]|jgi:EAL domain-containing protein (putative c-di-GMP-specific phosphodiesterase class I)/PAS domain-containing protein/GGDEF domain-containing protein|nr:EAL domain-containing protein [Spongiibacteraceae bacterium]